MESKERTINKARDLFFRYGFKSVSMDDIATEVGMSKKTLYQLFKDKDELVDDVIGLELCHNEILCAQQQNQSENAIHEIFLSLGQMNDILSMVNPLLLYEMKKYHPASHEKFTNHKNKFFVELVKQNLQRGIKEGLYKQEIDIDVLSKFRISSTFLVFDNDVFPQKKYSLMHVMQELTYNFLYGMATPQGQKLISKYKQSAKKS